MSDALTPNEAEQAPGSTAATAGEAAEERIMPSSQPVLLKALRWGAIATLGLLVVCGGIGWLIAQGPGLVGGVLGAVFAGVFLGLTVGSIAFANRFVGSDLYVALFFGIVLGTWVLKFVLFIVMALTLRDQPWLDPKILFVSLVAGIIMSLVIDVLVVAKSRLPYVSDPSV